MQWLVTDHAVSQYRARLAPHMSEVEARKSLESQAAGAHLVKKTRDNRELWRAPRPFRTRYIVEQQGSERRLVTVLEGNEAMKPRTRGSQLECSLRVLQRLLVANGPVPMQSLVAVCGRSERTAYRHLESLIELGLPVKRSAGDVELSRAAFDAWLVAR